MPVYFVRNAENRTIISADCTEDDLRCSVNVRRYSEELVNQGLDQRFIEDIAQGAELRSEYWERVKVSEPNKTPSELAESRYRDIAKKYGLRFVVD